MNADESISTRPYLIRALHEWCTDNGFTPHVAVKVDRSVSVPQEYVSNGEIVLNVGVDATSDLQIGNDFLEFKARFGGQPREIMVPIGRIIAIYARENGQGMAFPPPVDLISDPADGNGVLSHELPTIEDARPLVQLVPDRKAASRAPQLEPTPTSDNDGAPKRPSLKRVK